MFVCNCCGECCRNLDKTNIYKTLNRGDGICRYLVGNKCSIYKDRPLLCRVDESYEVLFKDRYQKAEYYEMNYKACQKLQNKGG